MSGAELYMPRTGAFEKYSDVYDRWFERNPILYDAELEAVRQLLPPSEAEGMEVGVGSGKFAVPLGIQVGVEPSEKMAAKARAQGVEVYAGVAEMLPFPDGRFDFVLMVTTICFVDDIVKSFREVLRVLKPDGSVIVGFVDKESRLGRQYMDSREKSRFYSEAVFFSCREVLDYLNEAGFEVVRVKQTLIPGELPEVVLDGFGEGSFVAIKGMRQLSC